MPSRPSLRNKVQRLRNTPKEPAAVACRVRPAAHGLRGAAQACLFSNTARRDSPLAPNERAEWFFFFRGGTACRLREDVCAAAGVRSPARAITASIQRRLPGAGWRGGWLHRARASKPPGGGERTGGRLPRRRLRGRRDACVYGGERVMCDLFRSHSTAVRTIALVGAHDHHRRMRQRRGVTVRSDQRRCDVVFASRHAMERHRRR
jgi:hypothetical protein